MELDSVVIEISDPGAEFDTWGEAREVRLPVTNINIHTRAHAPTLQPHHADTYMRTSIRRPRCVHLRCLVAPFLRRFLSLDSALV